MVYILLLILVLLLVCSAIISGSETSIFSLSPDDTEEFKEKSEDEVSMKRVIELKNDSNGFLSVILIANNLVNIAATLVANRLLDELLSGITLSDTVYFILKVVVVTFILLLCGEIFPKIMAKSKPRGFSLLSVNFIYFLSKILYPLSWILVKLGGAIANRVPVQDINVNRSQLQQAIQITETDSQQDKRILSGIASFSTLEAVEICIARVDVFALSEQTPFDEVLRCIIDKGYSRIPVYVEDLDHITGILFVKDLIPFIDEKPDFNWRKLLREPYFVPEHKKIDDILSEFRKRKTHLAVVVDEYGGTLGIVTMEDILEEIMGDISDETDKNEVQYKKISKNTWLFDGRTHIVDFLRTVELAPDYLDDLKGESDTLAGVMLEIKGQFFKKSESISGAGITFTAEDVEGFKIKTIKVTLRDDLLQ